MQALFIHKKHVAKLGDNDNGYCLGGPWGAFSKTVSVF